MRQVGIGRDVLSLSSVFVLLLVMGSAGRGADNEGVQRYKMQSVLEYSGKTQFCNKAEVVFATKKHLLGEGKAKHVISAGDLTGIGMDNTVQLSLKELTFVIDRKTQRMSGTSEGMSLIEKVTNQCAMSLNEVTKDSVGKTWKQTFDLSSIGDSVPVELNFTLTAIPIETQAHGELIAVRALSEPFGMAIPGGSAVCRMNCAYVFCSGFEDIFFSASLFGATTNCNRYWEKLKHSVTAWKVDHSGEPAELDELGENMDFGKFVGKLGVTRNIEVVKAGPLPPWARSEGVRAAQVANICASVSCEGALNPVATIYLPAASTVGLQSFSESLTLNTILVGVEGHERPRGAVGGEGLKWWPPWANIGWNWPTAAWGTGLGLGIAGAAGAFDSDGGSNAVRSPSTP